MNNVCSFEIDPVCFRIPWWDNKYRTLAGSSWFTCIFWQKNLISVSSMRWKIVQNKYVNTRIFYFVLKILWFDNQFLFDYFNTFCNNRWILLKYWVSCFPLQFQPFSFYWKRRLCWRNVYSENILLFSKYHILLEDYLRNLCSSEREEYSILPNSMHL